MFRQPSFLPRLQSAVYPNPIRIARSIAPTLRLQTYSSLRRPRQYGKCSQLFLKRSLNILMHNAGPRGRILNHVENLRPVTAQRSSRSPQKSMQPNITVEEDKHFTANPAETQVEIPQPTAGAVVTPSYHGAPLLSQSALVVGREFEMLNIFLVSVYPVFDVHPPFPWLRGSCALKN